MSPQFRLGIYDLVEAMDNVESAEAAGDVYPTTQVLTADGVVSLIGCLMGNPFINAVYIGHPGWKAMGGRIGYSAATGVMVIVLSWFGIISVMSSLIPLVAISPILLYIGMLIGAQAFQETPKHHAPAIVLALITEHCRPGASFWSTAHSRRGEPTQQQLGSTNSARWACSITVLEVLAGSAILSGMRIRRHRCVHHRQEVRGSIGVRGRRCSAHVLWLHAR